MHLATTDLGVGFRTSHIVNPLERGHTAFGPPGHERAATTQLRGWGTSAWFVRWVLLGFNTEDRLGPQRATEKKPIARFARSAICFLRGSLWFSVLTVLK